jgi:predicted nucleic acid-binding protein
VLEVVSILVCKRNDARLPVDLYDQAIADFRAEVINKTDFAIPTVDDALMLASIDLIETRHLNATDAIILRSAIDLQAAVGATDQVVLVTSDKRLVRAAPLERLRVFESRSRQRGSIATDVAANVKRFLNAVRTKNREQRTENLE